MMAKKGFINLILYSGVINEAICKSNSKGIHYQGRVNVYCKSAAHFGSETPWPLARPVIGDRHYWLWPVILRAVKEKLKGILGECV